MTERRAVRIMEKWTQKKNNNNVRNEKMKAKRGEGRKRRETEEAVGCVKMGRGEQLESM